jgi:dihydrofolate reductase (trimethoprim resistance protein)
MYSVPTFKLGVTVRKKSGSQWEGKVVGTYSTDLTPEGYAVESSTHAGSVQIYPVGALELVPADGQTALALD